MLGLLAVCRCIFMLVGEVIDFCVRPPTTVTILKIKNKYDIKL